MSRNVRTTIEAPNNEAFDACLDLLDTFQIFKATRRRFIIVTEELPIEMIDLLQEKGANITMRTIGAE